MAIALGQPVDEITHGLESIKIGGHVMPSDKASEVQVGCTLPSPDVLNVQALSHEGHEHPGSEVAVRMNPSDVSCVDQSMVYPSVELAQPCFDYIDVDQMSISGAPKFSPLFQGPIYTGYPAPIVNAHGSLPYSSEGVIYQNPVVEFNPVYNQNFYCSAPCTVGQFNYAYGQAYAYPQYQVAPAEQYNIAAAFPPDDGMVMPDGSFMPFAYQHMNSEVGHGQLIPMAMTGPSPACNNVPGFHPMPYSPICMPHVLNAASPAWVHQPMNTKGLNEEAQLKSGSQQPNISTDCNLLVSKSEKTDSRVQMADGKKLSRKQYGAAPLYGVPMPIKGSWVRSGPLPCANLPQPLKPFGGKNKSPGACPLNVEQFNLANFSTEFEDAKHFIIKSFSDENVYRSLQHGVWASTPHGNKKLDEAYQDAQRRAVGKDKGCPVFLYFSVNGSGRFCGVAEMTGPVDFNNTMDFWERNRWCGSFPVKWHFVKDVPHCQLRRIILQNNENKPVTSSRDTQEVNFEQGLVMLNIIKSYSTTASILDNFPNVGPQKIVPEVKIEQQSLESSGDSRLAQECSVSMVLESSNALRACNGEAKARENAQGKLNLGKAETPVQDSAADIGGRKLDKENVRISESA